MAHSECGGRLREPMSTATTVDIRRCNLRLDPGPYRRLTGGVRNVVPGNVEAIGYRRQSVAQIIHILLL